MDRLYWVSRLDRGDACAQVFGSLLLIPNSLLWGDRCTAIISAQTTRESLISMPLEPSSVQTGFSVVKTNRAVTHRAPVIKQL